MRAPLTPIKAFIHDAATLGQQADNFAADDPRLSQWLLVAQASERLARLKPAERGEYVTMLRTSVLPLRAGRPTQIEGDGRVPTDALAELAERLRLDAEDMERAGCFELALTTVASVCQMLSRRPERLTARLLATAHLGRVVRQIGEFNSAVDCYTTVTTEGQAMKDGPVAAHGYIGLGNVAHARGNRPSQKAFFLKALDLAVKGSRVELSAHQGLLVTANLEGHLADALLHGWRAHDLAPPKSEAQYETVTNMSHTALHSGFYAAAQSGFDYVVLHALVPRIRLPAITGSIRAATRLKEHHKLDSFEDQGRIEASRTSNPFETAAFYFWAAVARKEFGDLAAAAPLLQSSLYLAEKFGLHELRLRAENLLTSDADSTPAGPSPASRYADDNDPVVMDGIGRLTALATV